MKLEGSTNGRQYRTFSRHGHHSSSTTPAAPLQQHHSSSTTTNVLLQGGFICAALVLFSAAIAKSIWVASDPFWESKVFGGAILFVASIVSDVWVSLLLLFGKQRRLISGIATLLHCIFLVYGLMVYLYGFSCNCFGKTQLPFASIVLYNLIAVTFFSWASRFTSQGHRFQLVSFPTLGSQCGWALGLGICLFVYFTSSANGHSQLELVFSNLPSVQIGQAVELKLQIINHTHETVRITGGGVSCTCLTLNDLPTTIAPHEIKQMEVRLNPGQQFASKDKVVQSIVYYIEGIAQTELRGTISLKLEE